MKGTDERGYSIADLKEGPALTPCEPWAKVAGCSVRTIQNLCARGDLRAVRVGRLWRVNRDAALKYFGLE